MSVEVFTGIVVAVVLAVGWLGWKLSGAYLEHPELERLHGERRQARHASSLTMAEIPSRLEPIVRAQTPEDLECHRRG